MNSLTIRIEGDSGDGILTVGKIFAKVAARTGYHVFTYSSFLPIVRGGLVSFQLRISGSPILSQGDTPDLVLSLNDKATVRYFSSLDKRSVLFHTPLGTESSQSSQGCVSYPMDFRKAALEATQGTKSLNMVVAGFIISLLKMSFSDLVRAVEETFKGKKEALIPVNMAAAEAGCVLGKQYIERFPQFHIEPVDRKSRLLLTGNEAVALGAICAGIRFFAGYPITPASEIMEWLAKYLPRFGGKMVQAEDEIAALGMCIGASFGGVKAMTATSGPGLSLMTELIGLAGMAETPLVIVDVQRAGPSTGMPTKDSQADLNLAIHGTHGEVPRVVLAPQTVNHCFYDTLRAINIAHEFQIPVIILSSQSLSHRMQTIDIPEPERIAPYDERFFSPNDTDDLVPFTRYAETPDGRPSPRSIPGTPKGMYRCGGLEHDLFGNPTSSTRMRTLMVERRRNRMHAIERAFSESIAVDHKEIEHGKNQPVGILSWGTTASTLREVLQTTTRAGWDITAFRPRVLWPLPDTLFKTFLQTGFRILFIAEQNATHQMAELVKARYSQILIEHNIKVISICKDDGTPFTHDELLSKILLHLSNELSANDTIMPIIQELSKQYTSGATQND